MYPMDLGRTKDAQQIPAQYDEAYNDDIIDRLKGIIDLVESLPVDKESKVRTFEKLMVTVNEDEKLDSAHKYYAKLLIEGTLNRLNNEDVNDKSFDYRGDQIISKNMNVSSKPVMVDPDEVNLFNALHTVNMYLSLGMPCLVGLSEGYGMFTMTSNITYEMIVGLSKVPDIDRLWFTDGKGMAIVK